MVDISSLSEKLNVSEVTIRRDLDKLEKEGFVNKTYGGAILNKNFNFNANPNQAAAAGGDCSEEVRLICEIVLQMIQGEESLFLGGGPIGREVARNISGKNKLLVITNDVFVATELYEHPNVKVTMTGGDLTSSGTMVGPCALRMLNEVYINKAFIEIKGADLRFGYSMESYDEVEIVKALMNISKEVIALADCSKFNTVSFTRLGDLNLFPKVVSNKDISEAYKQYYFDNYIKLYTTYEVS